MNIVLVTPDYPNIVTPTAFVFTQNIAWAFRDLGHEVTVICPLNLFKKRDYINVPESIEEKTLNGNTLKVFFPKFSAPWISYKNPVDLIGIYATKTFTKKVDMILQKNKIKPQVLYAQFLYPAGVCVSTLKHKYCAKAIASFGESSFWSISKYFKSKTIRALNDLDGIDSVSTENKRRLLDAGIQRENTIKVFPNGIDSKRYYAMDKTECRKRFGFKHDAFIVAFLGGFIERKGVLRVAQALTSCEDISVAYAGKGPQQPHSKNTIYQKAVPPEEVSCFLSAADVFVLPTLNEGCCNAIIEAMACGLPIVSSNLPFNDDILNDDNSIRVDPLNVEQIRNAVLQIKNDNILWKKMHEESLKMAAALDICDRAARLVEFFKVL